MTQIPGGESGWAFLFKLECGKLLSRWITPRLSLGKCVFQWFHDMLSCRYKFSDNINVISRVLIEHLRAGVGESV